MNRNWTDLITEYTLDMPGNSLDFTHNAAHEIHDLIWMEDFDSSDSEMIYKYLKEKISVVSFSDYLKRYIYEKAELRGDYRAISDRVYQEIIIGSFQDTNTPKSFHETSTKLNAMVKNWLRQDIVSRDTIFILGFGLNMPVEDVSLFLTKAIRDHDFNFNNPEEVIYWFSLKNHYGAARTMQILDEYKTLEPDYSDPMDDHTIVVKSQVSLLAENELFSFLRKLKCRDRKYPFSYTAKNEFERLLAETKETILQLRKESGEDISEINISDISNAEVERNLFNGIPLDQKGNLLGASASHLKKNFSQKRLNRQRIASILNNKFPVERSDLMTLNFFVHAARARDLLPNERYHRFIKDTNELLEKCYMGKINISNPYEAFILMCLLTDYPLDSFSDVWAYSYDEETHYTDGAN